MNLLLLALAPSFVPKVSGATTSMRRIPFSACGPALLASMPKKSLVLKLEMRPARNVKLDTIAKEPIGLSCSASRGITAQTSRLRDSRSSHAPLEPTILAMVQSTVVVLA